MSFDISELTNNYQYPMIEINDGKIVGANHSARFFFGRILETNRISDLLGEDAAQSLKKIIKNGGTEWNGSIRLAGGEVRAELAVIQRKAYIVAKPAGTESGLPFDSVISDYGQMAKEPLMNLYAALQQLEDCGAEEFRTQLGIARHNFYILTCLSENQIAQAQVQPLEHCNNMRLMPLRETLSEIIAAANETLGDRNIVLELDGGAPDKYCYIYKKKLIQLVMTLLADAVHSLGGGTVNIGFRAEDACAYIEIPVNKRVISLFDFSDYIAAAGTHSVKTSLESQMLLKLINNFNAVHKSRIFASVAKGGADSVVIAIQTETPDSLDVFQHNPEFLFGGLRPDLIFLSGELKAESYEPDPES